MPYQHKINLLYGKRYQTLSIPSALKYKILTAKEPRALTNFFQTFSQCLKNPIGSASFDSIFTPKDKIAIIIPDKTRRCYADKVLDILIKQLNKKRINNQNITIILARGLHPPHTPSEIKKLVGERTYGSVKIIDHNAMEPDEMVYIGTTSRGTRLTINRNCARADKIITIGTIGYHYYAGFSGGRKLILPGIAGCDSIQQNHSLVLNKPPLSGKNPAACLGKLDGNPVNEDMIEAAKLVDVDFSINLVLNNKGETIKIFCGDIIKAHKKGCEFLDRIYRINIRSKADYVIASCGGYPSDINFIQTHKTMENASYALKEKGKMLILSECAEGIGSDILLKWLNYRSTEDMEKALRKKFVVSGHTALSSLMKAKRFDIYFYSNLKSSIVKKLHLRPVDNLQRTLKQFFSHPLRTDGTGAKVFILPEGSTSVPLLLTTGLNGFNGLQFRSILLNPVV